MIQFRNVCKRFHGISALHDVSFDVASGSVHALVGENGAGKSTLMKILSGVHDDYDGTISIDGNIARFDSPAAAQNAGVGIIHQELNLVPQLTVAENIFLGREPTVGGAFVKSTAIRARGTALLNRLGLDIHPNRIVGSLRVGEQQLVEIAKALSLNANVLIFDEPTSALSETETAYLFRVIGDLKQLGVTIMYISHKLHEVFALSDAITVLRDGECVGTVAVGEVSERDVIRMMVGRELTDLFPKTVTPIGEPLLSLHNVTFNARVGSGLRSLHDISFDVRRGEILGLAGLMGSGRSEVLMAMYGALPTSRRSGRISLNGQDVTSRSPQEAISHHIAFVPEDRKFQSIVHQLSVRKNMTLASLSKVSTSAVVSPKKERSVARTFVSKLGVKTPGIDAGIDDLSGGNQQKVVLAKCLMTNPDVLLLDEPTRGIDVRAKSEIYGLMSQIAAEGTAIVMASSELPELLAMCDRILVLSEGRISGELVASHASQESIMSAATGHKQEILEPAGGM